MAASGDSDPDTAFGYAKGHDCQILAEHVPVDMIQHGKLLSRVLLTHFSGLWSASADK